MGDISSSFEILNTHTHLKDGKDYDEYERNEVDLQVSSVTSNEAAKSLQTVQWILFQQENADCALNKVDLFIKSESKIKAAFINHFFSRTSR